MIQIILGSLALSITHALIPNHWIPLVVLSKAEKWNRFETAKITAIAGFSHTLSTILIGIFVGLLGYKLNDFMNSVGSLYAPVILTLLGLIYIFLDYRNNKKHDSHGHHHHHHHEHFDTAKIRESRKRSNTALIVSLSTAMFFSPCAEIEAYYFSVGVYGWTGIIALSIIYLLITIICMVILVDLGVKGIGKIDKKFHFLEHHEKLITGVILILLGIVSYFVKF
ncbi:MAG: hypothetical protein K8I03_07680 [Ignavibacteria bacterium]|nr:hypothetical protein [Ignavibacteria bacterium]